MKTMNSKVDGCVNRARKWQEETKKLRAILLGLDLSEELKWGKPCYTFQGSNIVIIQGFKEYCALLFCKGALLKDPDGILVKPGENTQAARQIRFTELREISSREHIIKAYVREAIEVERAGLEVAYKKTSDFEVPEELQKNFKEAPELKTAFKALTPGRQRAYLLYFSAPKQSKTREARIAKYTGQILNEKGLND
jgi:uncharacterized protein YdeI (YjbR/CyaY-like superfamily)